MTTYAAVIGEHSDRVVTGPLHLVIDYVRANHIPDVIDHIAEVVRKQFLGSDVDIQPEIDSRSFHAALEWIEVVE